MSNSFFFKQFSIYQTEASFKVSTDPVLLGSWVSCNQTPKRILDIGTGTGILALMMAQKFPNSELDAIDIQAESITEARYNFDRSPWSERLKAIEQNVLTFTTQKKYDLIVCNPPYFNTGGENSTNRKTIARHQKELTIEELLNKVSSLLSLSGTFYLCFPYEKQSVVLATASKEKLYLNAILNVTPTINNHPYLSIYQFSKILIQTTKSQHLAIRNIANQYTEEYINFTSDFYLDLSKKTVLNSTAF